MRSLKEFEAILIERLLTSDPQGNFANEGETGEIVTITDEDRRTVEDGEDADDLPEWQQSRGFLEPITGWS